MSNFLEHLLSSAWNALRERGSKSAAKEHTGLSLGYVVKDEAATRHEYLLSNVRRTTHLACLGRTGSGKSRLLLSMAQSDIKAGRGFIWFDLHGDATPFLLGTIAERERKLQRHLSDRVVLIAPADRDYSVGFNPLEHGTPDFVRIAEFAAILKRRWNLDSFGARTDELLRNILFVLAANGMTLVELSLLLTHSGFLAACLEKVENPEVRHYFESRWVKVSEPMRRVMAEPILNKVSAFTADPHFRHIVGQRASTFSIREAMDRGYWVIVNLDKGRLGEQALTLASLLFNLLKNALFTRERRSLFSVYADEIQNYVDFESGIETMLSESRKFAVSVVSANQFLDQYPPAMRAAILSVGNHLYFQLSSADALTIAQALDGNRSLAERLKNLSQRHFVVKSGAEPWTELVAHSVSDPKASYADLLTRVRAGTARSRTEIEREIAARHASVRKTTDEVLHGWD